ncbi:MAG: glycoside hydrolase family 30 beta sandwich domain-containing protein [Planctomycetota bacterium]
MNTPARSIVCPMLMAPLIAHATVASAGTPASELDADQDGLVTTLDLAAFLSLLDVGDTGADVLGDGTPDAFDLTEFLVQLPGALPAPDTVRVWLTSNSDGDARDAALLPYGDANPFDESQDDGYLLFSEQPPLAVQTAPISAEWRVQINRASTLHPVKGIGAAMTDGSAYLLHQLSINNPELYAWTTDRLFCRQNGAGFSYLRKPIGSSDFTATPTYYTYADRSTPDLAGFSISHDLAYIVPQLHQALSINPSIEIMGSPWSPPAWMKTSGKLTGLTGLDLAQQMTNRLKPEFFGVFAEYLLKFVEAYDAVGIQINALTLQNEPEFDTADYPCMRMTSGDQIEVIKQLGPMLDAQGFNTEIVVHDHNWLLNPFDVAPPWDDPSQSPIDAVRSVFDDPIAGPYATGSAWHCYFGNDDDMRATYAQITGEYPDKLIYTTELTAWGANRGSWWPDVDFGLRYNWMGGIASGASVALEWNLVLDQDFGPTLREDSQGVGLATINTDTWEDVRFEREFYAMAQVSQAAHPGSHVAGSRVTRFGVVQSDPDIRALAFVLPDGGYSVVIVNTLTADRTVAVETADGEAFSITVPARGIATAVRRLP